MIKKGYIITIQNLKNLESELSININEEEKNSIINLLEKYFHKC